MGTKDAEVGDRQGRTEGEPWGCDTKRLDFGNIRLLVGKSQNYN